MGFEIFDVTKRDYDLRFGTFDYDNGTIFTRHRNYGRIQYAKASIGEYLAGDKGTTFEISDIQKWSSLEFL